MPPLPCYEVMLEDKANAINSLLQMETIVALVGMGGIGKTTLSKKMYHLFHNQYEKSSILEDVKSKDINNVKKKLLQDLCDRKLHKHEDVDEYLNEIKQCMISKKVLAVADDVGMIKNLEALQLPIDKHAINVDCKSKVFVKLSKLENIEKSCEGICKSRHGIIGGKTNKRTFHVPCIQTYKWCDK